MAGIFNFFSDISQPEKGPTMKSLSRSKTSIGTIHNSMKSVGLPKPKGLSIRSNSDLNIPSTVPVTSIKQDGTLNKDKNFLKPSRTQLGADGRPLSPGRDSLKQKREVVECRKVKLQKTSNDHCFKKPLTPRKQTKSFIFPEPEKLASYYDFQSEFENVYNTDLEDEFKEFFLLKHKLVKPYEDEGFISDPECLPSPDIPSLSISMNSLDTISLEDDCLSLPELQDDDLFF